MEDTLRTYDITTMLIEEDDAPVRTLIQEHGGKIISSQPTVKVNLAYPIKKRTTAFMAVFLATFLPDTLHGFGKALIMSEHVLRALVLQADTVSTQPEKRAVEKEPAYTRGKKEGFLSNEALEQKIEELT